MCTSCPMRCRLCIQPTTANNAGRKWGDRVGVRPAVWQHAGTSHLVMVLLFCYLKIS